MNTALIAPLLKYFPNLTASQQAHFEALSDLYKEWNDKINVISRKDIDHLYLHHVLHSLGIAKVVTFRPGSLILDVGTGGGFPGIPLAILYPDCRFKLIDSIGKKVRVAAAVAEAIGLTNIDIEHLNVKEEKGKYHFVVSRAVMRADELVRLVRKNVSRTQSGASLPNGLICLKGGDLTAETQQLPQSVEFELKSYFTEPFFETKKVLHVSL